MYRILTFLLAIAAMPSLWADEMNLVIPGSQEDMRELMKQDDSPCEGCGVVTNVRQMAGVASDSRQDKPYEVPILELSRAGPGEDVKMTDHIGSGKTLDELRQQPSGRWLVTVRYDNGAYAAFEQDLQPSVQKGDRVKVVDGRVELK